MSTPEETAPYGSGPAQQDQQGQQGQRASRARSARRSSACAPTTCAR